MLSGRVICVEPITRPEESYRVWCVTECYTETSRMRRPWPTWGCRAKIKKNGSVVNVLIMDSVDCATVCSEMSVTVHVTTREAV